MASFSARLDERLEACRSRVSVGLDPDPSALPLGVARDLDGLRAFLMRTIDATAPYAAAFKPNSAFYEAFGVGGFGVLHDVCRHIKEETDALLILDVKRGDVGHTAEAYAKSAFGVFRADAATVSPYLGVEAVAPFSAAPDRGAFVLVRTSNKGAGEVQDLRVEDTTLGGSVGTAPLYLAIARRVLSWNQNRNLGLVTGGTWPGEVRRIREAVGDALPFLVPGVGAQGGDARTAAQAAMDSNGRGFLVNSGRAILHASDGRDHAQAAARAAERLRDQIQAVVAHAPNP